jgi:hypothetical protein
MEAAPLLEAISSAFHGVERGSRSLRQFLLIDQKEMAGEITPEEFADAGNSRSDTTWKDISDREIEECNCQLAHMEAEEFRYYLPAYMSYSIRNVHAPWWDLDILGFTVSSLSPSDWTGTSSYIVSQLRLLNEAQRNVVVAFLHFVAEHADRYHSPDAKEALEQYWAKRSDAEPSDGAESR